MAHRIFINQYDCVGFCLCFLSFFLCLFYARSPNWFALAEYDNTPTGKGPAYSYITAGNPKGGVALTFQNGKYGTNDVTLTMKFLCGTGAPVYVPNHDQAYQWSVTITSPQGCPIESSSSGGGTGGNTGSMISSSTGSMISSSTGGGSDAPFPCSWYGLDGSYFDFSGE